MGMESVYKLSVILNLVDNLSSQMNGVQSSVSEVSASSTLPLEPCRRQEQPWQE